ncbi:aspartate/glutamate racemase family protein [Sphingomonas sp. IC4-52]|uniref:aspartate/glutamate racemase family protein n=1 Tax=Sphingomonas sp. IC4-52 TaxID=2887202 RepID=UPI001D1210ED|nr:amino acid racemase [Sphingomonas sp. IC4-52]MCC2981247.1 amino acid racemase [Sphingomonas sp. IC4-52]
MTALPLTIGVLGGMGPAATIDFMAKVLRHSQAGAAREQDNVRLIVDSNPSLPDRNAAVARTGPSPAPGLAAMARGLEAAGAQVLVMPCNAAHAFADAVKDATPLPFLHLVEETVAAVTRDHGQARRIGVLAVNGAAEARLYERALEARELQPVIPDQATRAAFMEAVWQIKAGDLARGREGVLGAAMRLIEQGAEVIIAGCTEVPLVVGPKDLPVPLVDSTDILAQRAVEFARGAA